MWWKSKHGFVPEFLCSVVPVQMETPPQWCPCHCCPQRWQHSCVVPPSFSPATPQSHQTTMAELQQRIALSHRSPTSDRKSSTLSWILQITYPPASWINYTSPNPTSLSVNQDSIFGITFAMDSIIKMTNTSFVYMQDQDKCWLQCLTESSFHNWWLALFRLINFVNDWLVHTSDQGMNCDLEWFFIIFMQNFMSFHDSSVKIVSRQWVQIWQDGRTEVIFLNEVAGLRGGRERTKYWTMYVYADVYLDMMKPQINKKLTNCFFSFIGILVYARSMIDQ